MHMPVRVHANAKCDKRKRQQTSASQRRRQVCGAMQATAQPTQWSPLVGTGRERGRADAKGLSGRAAAGVAGLKLC